MEEKEFYWNEHVKVFVHACLMPHGETTFNTIGIELINFRRKEVEVQCIHYGNAQILPEYIVAKDPTMPHIIDERNRWFFYLSPHAMETLVANNQVLEEVCVTTTRGYRFASESK